jgi:hypothetical protein
MVQLPLCTFRTPPLHSFHTGCPHSPSRLTDTVTAYDSDWEIYKIAKRNDRVPAGRGLLPPTHTHTRYYESRTQLSRDVCSKSHSVASTVCPLASLVGQQYLSIPDTARLLHMAADGWPLHNAHYVRCVVYAFCDSLLACCCDRMAVWSGVPWSSWVVIADRPSRGNSTDVPNSVQCSSELSRIACFKMATTHLVHLVISVVCDWLVSECRLLKGHLLSLRYYYYYYYLFIYI